MDDRRVVGSDARVHNALERLKKHPVLSIALFVSLMAGTAAGLLNLLGSGTSLLTDVLNPHAEQYAALADLDLDVRFEYFEENFGTAKSVVEVCPSPSPCPGEVEVLNLYIHETDQTIVRALFEGNSLRGYLVTTMDKAFRPNVKWLDQNLGRLGQVSAEKMLGAFPVDPTDTSARWGMRWVSYVDVVALGPPGRYRGLVLAWSPEGLQTPIDVEATRLLSAWDPGVGGEAFDLELARLRAGTTPNTYGEFRDDGDTGTWLRDADVVQGLLFLNAEF